MPLTLNGTTGIAGVDGSAGTPATKGSDTDTGIVYGTNTVQIATNGATAVTVDASQNVGIGTATPAGKLDVVATSATSTLFVRSSGIANGAQVAQDTGGTAYFINGYASGWTYVGGAGPNCIFTTGSTERARIDSSGTAMFNCTTQIIRGSETFRVQLNTGLASFITSTAGNPVIALRNSGTNGYMMAFNNASAEIGTISSSGSNVAYNTSSDYRLKENIKPMSGALSKLAQIKPVTFTWKADGSDGQGFIAHELQSVVPECVTGEKDAVDQNGKPKYQGVDTSFLVATLTAAIQELSAKLDAAEARIAALEAK